MVGVKVWSSFHRCGVDARCMTRQLYELQNIRWSVVWQNAHHLRTIANIDYVYGG